MATPTGNYDPRHPLVRTLFLLQILLYFAPPSPWLRHCRVLLSFLYPYCQRRVLGSRSLLVVYFTSTKSPRGPPWNEGHRPKVRHETSVFEVPAQEQHKHSFTLVLLIRLLHVLCTRYTGITHHWALQTSG